MRFANVRLFFALAPALTLGTIAVALAENVEPADWRFVLLFTAVGAVAAASWRVGAAALGGTITRAHGVPGRLRLVAHSERRGPVTDKHTGLHADWYFKLRIDEEIARATRYEQPFTVIGISSHSTDTLEAVRMVVQESLREVDFAGDLGQKVAVCLPNTSRSGAWSVVARFTEVTKGVDIRLSEFPADGSTLSALLGDAKAGGIRDFAA
ncbi:MAG: hypothetical protein HY873_01995 [Chloroflexi bacterium]|nr:hypothetical protein [Chloroflexota bacterium]